MVKPVYAITIAVGHGINKCDHTAT